MNVVDDVRMDPDYWMFEETVQSELCVPVISRGRAAGVLQFESTRINNYTRQDADFGEAIASIIAVYLEKYIKVHLETPSADALAATSGDIAFVLMPFHEPFNKYYQSIIGPAVQKAGLVPVRADEIYRPSEIIKDIYDFIGKARLIIAELTGRNPNVLYELGFSHALGKSAVLLTQTIDDVPFDLRGFRCIVYDTTDPEWSEKLRSQIVKFIAGTNHEDS